MGNPLENLCPDTVWASPRERVYVLRVGKSKNIISPRCYVDFFVPQIGERWLEVHEFLETYSFLGFPRLTRDSICSDENLELSNIAFSPRLL